MPAGDSAATPSRDAVAGGGTAAPDAAETSGAAANAKLPEREEGLDNGSTKTRSAGGFPLQENPVAGCTLCHVDEENAFLGGKHFEEKVGCRTCHGPSLGHIADEKNDVKPDEVFARPDVDRLCGFCHECGRPDEPEPEKAADALPKVCNECHGQHDLALVQ
jgi:hypothetical protein